MDKLSAATALADYLENASDDGSEGLPFDQDELDLILLALRSLREPEAQAVAKVRSLAPGWIDWQSGVLPLPDGTSLYARAAPSEPEAQAVAEVVYDARLSSPFIHPLVDLETLSAGTKLYAHAAAARLSEQNPEQHETDAWLLKDAPPCRLNETESGGSAAQGTGTYHTISAPQAPSQLTSLPDPYASVPMGLVGTGYGKPGDPADPATPETDAATIDERHCSVTAAEIAENDAALADPCKGGTVFYVRASVSRLLERSRDALRTRALAFEHSLDLAQEINEQLRERLAEAESDSAHNYQSWEIAKQALAEAQALADSFCRAHGEAEQARVQAIAAHDKEFCLRRMAELARERAITTLKVARLMTKGEQVEHAIVDPTRPDEGLGAYLEAALASQEPSKSITKETKDHVSAVDEENHGLRQQLKGWPAVAQANEEMDNRLCAALESSYDHLRRYGVANASTEMALLNATSAIKEIGQLRQRAEAAEQDLGQALKDVEEADKRTELAERALVEVEAAHKAMAETAANMSLEIARRDDLLVKERQARERAQAELRNITEAKRFDRQLFRNDTAFADWALNRCRFALAGQEPSKSITKGE